MNFTTQDPFAEALEKWDIAAVWKILGLDGEPRLSCRSPFREDRRPSFSIYDDGRKWKDQATGDGGDVIEFIRHAIGGDHKAVREWLLERNGTDNRRAVVKVSSKPAKAAVAAKVIKWPAPNTQGSAFDLRLFASTRGISYSAALVASQSGILKFCKLDDGKKCFVITDGENRASEIRTITGDLFLTPSGNYSKAYPLKGVEKSWLPGAALLRDADHDTAVIMTEGATDLLSSIDLYVRYGESGGANSWCPVTLLGAGCNKLDPECAKLIAGRHVRIIPDADDAGDTMLKQWTQRFREMGCSVDSVTLPRGTDLSDHLSAISPTDLFSKVSPIISPPSPPLPPTPKPEPDIQAGDIPEDVFPVPAGGISFP